MLSAKAGWLVVAAVCVLGIVAAADALRQDTRPTSAPVRPPPQPTTATEAPPVSLAPLPLLGSARALRTTLVRDHVRGILFFTDDRCRLWGLAFPAVDWLDREPRPASCGFTLEKNDRIVMPGPRGVGSGSSARCQEGHSPGVGPLRAACAVARRPDGTLTLAEGASVLACADDRRSCPQVLLAPETLRDAVRVRAPGGELPTGLLITEIGWLSDSRLVAVVHVTWRAEGASEDVVTIFEDGRLLQPPVESAEFTGLRISPLRHYFVVRGRTFRGLWFFDREGRVLAINPIASGHHAAWSPDERWTAVATGGSVYLFRTADLPRFDSEPRPPTVRVPVYATDLAWG